MEWLAGSGGTTSTRAYVDVDGDGGGVEAAAADPASSDIGSWVTAAAAGDHEAWNRLVDRFAGTVWAIARGHRLSPADAADVSQTTWLRLVENLDRINSPERVGAWLGTTARRESLRVLRLAGRQVPNGDDLETIADPAPANGPAHNLIAQHRDRVLSDLVDRLPTRSALLLRLLSSEAPPSYRDISEMLDMPVGSIGPTRARALEQLRHLAAHAGVQWDDLMA